MKASVMSRREPGAAAALVLIALVTGCGRDPGEHEYSAQFTLELPEGWERHENYRDMPLVAVAPRDDESAFPVNLNVRLVGNPDGLDLDAFYARHFDDDIARSVQQNFQLVDESDRQLGAHPARRVVYTHRIEPDDLKSLTWVILAGGRAYVITCNAAADQFAEYEKVFDGIVASFDAG
jgi:DcrB